MDFDDNENDGEFDEPIFAPVDVNLVGTLKFLKLAIGYMRRQKRREGAKWMQGAGGSVVITTSATGYAPEQSLPVYGTTKAAVGSPPNLPVLTHLHLFAMHLQSPYNPILKTR